MAGRIVSGILSIFFPPPPELTVGQLEVGEMASVRGEVVPRDLIESPLTGDRCVYYLYTLDEWREAVAPQIAGDGFWRLIERDEAIAEFYLADVDDRVIIAPHQARVVRANGEELAEVDYGLIGRRARQLLIKPGDEIVVRGLVARADDLFDDGRGYRQSASRKMLVAPDNGRLEIKVL